MFWITCHQPLRTPMEALDRLVAALKSRDEGPISALTTKRGFEDLRNAARGYVGRGPALGSYLETEAGLIRRDDAWRMTDRNHASAGVWHSGGSGRHSDTIEMVKSGDGWKLDRYQRMYIDGPPPR